MAKNKFNILNARITFKNVPVHKITNYSFKDISTASESFKKINGVSECIIIQTASRVEIFLVSKSEYFAVEKIKEVWTSLTELEQIDIDHWDQTLEVYMNTDVYRNLLRLASGIESVVVGKEEILDEIKNMSSSAKQAGNSGKILGKLFDSSIRIATDIRNSTGIGIGIKSIGDIAVNLAEEKAGNIGSKKILLIGTGETAAMVAKCLNKQNHGFDVVSMSIERATGFSKTLGGNPVNFEDVIGFSKHDIVFVATTADYFIVTAKDMKKSMKKKKSGIMILDLSDPRAVELQVGMIPKIKALFRDEISELDDESGARRKKASTVEEAISKEVPILEESMKQLREGSIITAN